MSEKINDKSIALIIGVLIFCLLIVVSISAWTGPPAAPPDPNAPAPINVSSSGQEKEGQVGIAIPSGQSLDETYGLTVGTASNPLGIKTSGDLWIQERLRGIKPTGAFCSDNQVLKFDSVTSNWVCADDIGGIAGGGTDNYLARWNGSSALETSSIYQDDSGNVGIGNPTPLNKLEINTDGYSSGIDFDGRTAISGYSGDGWLRLNQDSEFPSGVYTPGLLRADASVRAPIFYDQNNTSYYVDPAGISNISGLKTNLIDAQGNYIYGQQNCWNVVIDSHGEFDNSAKGYCWDALGADWSPVAVSCYNVQEPINGILNKCEGSGDDNCYYYSMEVDLDNICDTSSGSGDAVVSCCKIRWTTGWP